MRYLLILIAAFVALSCGTAQAREVALVIANSMYDPQRDPLENPNLRNAANDAKLIAASLKDAGFEEVVVAINLSTDDFHRNLTKFANLADGADTAVIYFAGHGVRHKGTNWLIPTGVHLTNAKDLPFEAIQLELLLDALSGAKLRVAAIDACRNSAAELGSDDEDGLQSGLAGSQVKNALLIFAAAPGEFALDSVGGSIHSPFATSLSSQLSKMTRLHDIGGNIAEDVAKATGAMQTPVAMVGMGSKNAFLTTEQYQQAMAAMEDSAPTDRMVSLMQDKEVWKEAKADGSKEALEIYLEMFPDGMFRKFAELEIKRL